MKKLILVIGNGEVGSSIAQLEKKAGNDVHVIDLDSKSAPLTTYDVAHICLPYSNSFVKIVNDYMAAYPAVLIFVHSTVKPGTCRQLQRIKFLVHSPVIGKHPNLVKSLITFKKFVSGPPFAANPAMEHLKSLKIESEYMGRYETTELAKVLSTSFYGWMLSFMDRADKLCQKYQVTYEDVMTVWTKAYNKGYERLGYPQYVRPLLTPPGGKIGGHCVCPNARLIDDTKISREILRLE
jgi:UDP-glucose 6-dehydrogenase